MRVCVIRINAEFPETFAHYGFGSIIDSRAKILWLNNLARRIRIVETKFDWINDILIKKANGNVLKNGRIYFVSEIKICRLRSPELVVAFFCENVALYLIRHQLEKTRSAN